MGTEWGGVPDENQIRTQEREPQDGVTETSLLLELWGGAWGGHSNPSFGQAVKGWRDATRQLERKSWGGGWNEPPPVDVNWNLKRRANKHLPGRKLRLESDSDRMRET